MQTITYALSPLRGKLWVAVVECDMTTGRAQAGNSPDGSEGKEEGVPGVPSFLFPTPSSACTQPLAPVRLPLGLSGQRDLPGPLLPVQHSSAHRTGGRQPELIC